MLKTKATPSPLKLDTSMLTTNVKYTHMLKNKATPSLLSSLLC